MLNVITTPSVDVPTYGARYGLGERTAVVNGNVNVLGADVAGADPLSATAIRRVPAGDRGEAVNKTTIDRRRQETW